MWPEAVHHGQWYRLLTAAFLHANIEHIFFNMVILAIVGSPVEAEVGKVRFLVIYLISAFGGSVASYLLSNANVLGLGASGAIFGVMGSYFVLARRRGWDVATIAALIVIELAIGFGSSTIDWRAHLGGVITGAVVTLGLTRSTEPAPDTRPGCRNHSGGVFLSGCDRDPRHPDLAPTRTRQPLTRQAPCQTHRVSLLGDVGRLRGCAESTCACSKTQRRRVRPLFCCRISGPSARRPPPFPPISSGPWRTAATTRLVPGPAPAWSERRLASWPSKGDVFHSIPTSPGCPRRSVGPVSASPSSSISEPGPSGGASKRSAGPSIRSSGRTPDSIWSELGAAAVAYHRDFYGDMQDGINAGDHSDRCWVSWGLDAPRARARASAASAGPGVEEAVPAGAIRLLAVGPDGGPAPGTRLARESSPASARSVRYRRTSLRCGGRIRSTPGSGGMPCGMPWVQPWKPGLWPSR